MHIEPLDARLCFNAGTDTTFGTGGRVDISTGGAISAVAAAGDRVSVAFLDDGGANSFATFDSTGNYLGGYAGRHTAGSPNGEVDQVVLLSDGRAYALGATNTSTTAGGMRSHYASITRYTAAGVPDTTFGTDGTFVFDLSNATVTGVKLIDAVPSIDRGLFVGLDVTSHVGDQNVSEIVLLKLHGSGKRDTSFGSHGTTTVMQTTSDANTSAIDNLTGHDLTNGDAGTIRVLFTRMQGQQLAATASDPEGGVDAQFQLKSRTIDAYGVEDPSRAYSWQLAAASTQAGQDTRFAPLLIADDGPTSATVIGRTRTGNAVTRPQVFVLHAGHRPRVGVFATGSRTASQVVRTDTGKYFALLRGNVVARLHADFTLDPTFARGGFAKPDLTHLNPLSSLQLYAAPNDRALLPLDLEGGFDDELFLLRLG